LRLAQQIIAAYEGHGWKLRRILLRPRHAMNFNPVRMLSQGSLIDAEIDALWFARPSHDQREAGNYV
jgi:hypothetical protein